MMTYRTLLRIKVMQLLYAFESKNDKMLSVSENELIKSIQKTTDLYFHLLNLSVFITKYAEDCIEIAKNKFRPTQEELNPNMKFVNNLFVKQLLANIIPHKSIKSSVIKKSSKSVHIVKKELLQKKNMKKHANKL